MIPDRTHGGNITPYLKGRAIDFSVNINPLGLPPAIKETILKNIDALASYPQPDSKRLKDALASLHNVSSCNISAGNGSIELIYLIPKALNLKKALIPAPSFSEYEFAVKAGGGKCLFVKTREEEAFKIDVPGIIRLLPKVDSVFLGNPNNPTGYCLPLDQISLLADLCARHKVMLIIDEAFIDFVKNTDGLTMISSVLKNKFLIVLRSLTKFFAIPGLRLGYMAGERNLIKKISHLQYPWNVNSVAQLAGEKIIQNKDYIRESKKFIAREKEYLFYNLKNIKGLKVFPASANFILCKLETNKAQGRLAEKLLRRGLIIRNCKNFRGLDDRFFRVAVRKRNENNKLLAVLKGILCK